MDAGEGTVGQLWRAFGPAVAARMVRDLKCVWISHTHADHHLGLLSLLAKRPPPPPPPPSPSHAKEGGDEQQQQQEEQEEQEGFAPPLLVMGPERLRNWLAEYSAVDGAVRGKYTFVESRDMMSEGGEGSYNQGQGPKGHPRADELRRELGLTACFNVPVAHCPEAYGLVLRHASGWKLVYSGDTRPCERLVRAGRGADVLIHEATFEDGLENEARLKAHSTTAEAIGVGRKMGAHRVLLTHFSQRYPKVPVMDEASAAFACVACDLMTIRSRDMGWVPSLLPALQCVFGAAAEQEEAEDEQSKTAAAAEV